MPDSYFERLNVIIITCMLQGDINKSHVNIIILNVDIIYLEYLGTILALHLLAMSINELSKTFKLPHFPSLSKMHDL